MKYQVYNNPYLDAVIFDTDDRQEFEEYTDENNTQADCCVANGSVILGWDEDY